MRGIDAEEELTARIPRAPHGNPIYNTLPRCQPLAAYSLNLYMYIILGWVKSYHLCYDMLYYFFIEPTKQYLDFIST